MLFSPGDPLTLGESLPVLVNRNQIQSLKTTGIQSRPGNGSPNPVASQGSLTAPLHVQNVQSRLQRTSDVSTKVTVTFNRNPADGLFVETRVYVSGYKGNPAPVQVGSGQSPVSFALENTGEPVTVTVQSSGNLGQAPISTAPTTTLQLAKTGLATNPTNFGSGSPDWLGSAPGSNFPVRNVSGLWGTGTANQVKVLLARLDRSFTVRRITTRTGGPLAGSSSSLACYSYQGLSKVFAWENFATTTTGVTLTTILTTPVTLAAGFYYMACACNTTGAAPVTLGGYEATGTNEGVMPYNTQGIVRSGVAGNVMAGGVMPDTLGALAPGGGGWTVWPLWTMEP